MNSPPDPASPSPSTPSSGSPPPEESYPPTGPSNYLSNLSSHIGAAFGGSSASKRRLPSGSSFGAASSSRDAKTRRRGDSGRSGNQTWEGIKEGSVSSSTGKKEKDELIDPALVEYLRKEIGDPFLEPSSKS